MSDLIDAIKAGDIPRVETLLAEGSDPNAGDTWTRPLHTACKECQPAIVRLLLEKGADPNHLIGSALSALTCALQIGGKVYEDKIHEREDAFLEIVELLLDAGADPSKTGNRDYAPIIVAIPNGVKIFTRLFEAGATCKPKKLLKESILDSNRTYRHQLLAVIGVKPDVLLAEICADTAIPESARINSAQALIARGADVNKASAGATPLHHACASGSCELAAFLLEQGASSTAGLKKASNLGGQELAKGTTPRQMITDLIALIEEHGDSPEASLLSLRDAMA